MLRTVMNDFFKNIKVGMATLVDWFGKGASPVDKQVAEMRASVCVRCPMNQAGSWTDRWGEYADTVLGVFWWLKTKGCESTQDENLHICTACDCPMRVKIWVPREMIDDHLPESTKAKLWSECWMRKNEN